MLSFDKTISLGGALAILQLPNLFSVETGKGVQRRLKFWQGRLREIEERNVELSEKCVGGLVAKGKRRKKRQKVDNADLSQLSDYAAEVLYQIFFKGNQIIKSFFT